MPYHLYFFMSWLFALLSTRANTFHFASPRIRIESRAIRYIAIEWIGKVLLFSYTQFIVQREKRNNFTWAQATQSANNIETQMFGFPICFWVLVFFCGSTSVVWCISVNIFTAGKLWLLYKIGFLFCGNYPFGGGGSSNNLIRSAKLFKSKHTHVLQYCEKWIESIPLLNGWCLVRILVGLGARAL